MSRANSDAMLEREQEQDGVEMLQNKLDQPGTVYLASLGVLLQFAAVLAAACSPVHLGVLLLLQQAVRGTVAQGLAQGPQRDHVAFLATGISGGCRVARHSSLKAL